MPQGKICQEDKFDPQRDALLEFLKQDVHRDISGEIPLSGINYIWILARMHLTFMQIEEDLKAVRNPSWIAAYESREVKEKRVSLTMFGTFICMHKSAIANIFSSARARRGMLEDYGKGVPKSEGRPHESHLLG